MVHETFNGVYAGLGVIMGDSSPGTSQTHGLLKHMSRPRAVTGASKEMKQDQPEAQPQGSMGGLGRSHRVQWKQPTGRCGTGWNQRGLAAGEGCQGQGWGAGLEGQGGRGAQGRRSLSRDVEVSSYGANGGASQGAQKE